MTAIDLSRRRAFAMILAAALAGMTGACAAAHPVGERSCAALGQRVANANSGAVLLRSYEGEPAEPALRTAAFVYDNALAVVALVACGQRPAAERIGEALRRAALGDTRLRNAYRAGTVEANPLPNGWWDPGLNRWIEDAYQDGSATGNVAWAALALLALDEGARDLRWRDATRHLAQWIIANVGDAHGAGFFGGIQGFDPPQPLRWKSTEHNIDLVALFERLANLDADPRWLAAAATARAFVAAQWDDARGCFGIGSLPDGSANRGSSGLDTQLWPQLLSRATPAWRRALGCAEKEYAVRGGFDFNTDRDGLWVEGTAQAVLVYRTFGREREASGLLTTLAGQFAENGLLYAAREPRISTGLAIGPQSVSADFFYYRVPHLGATAWAALAATAYNPFAAHGARRADTSGSRRSR